MRKDETANILLGQLIVTSHRNAERLQAILLGVDTLAVLKRNERSVDVLYSVVMRISHKRSTSFKRDFSETNSGNA